MLDIGYQVGIGILLLSSSIHYIVNLKEVVDRVKSIMKISPDTLVKAAADHLPVTEAYVGAVRAKYFFVETW